MRSWRAVFAFPAPNAPYRPRILCKAEVSSRIVGDLVMATLKEVDQIAYIRYAIVYLGLDDLQSIRTEIDQLLDD